MGWVPIDNIGEFGLLTDTPHHVNPPNSWSEVSNFLFLGSQAVQSPGFFNLGLSIPFDPFALINCGQYNFLIAGQLKVYGIDDASGTFVDKTRLSGDYSALSVFAWSGGPFNGFGLINSFSDIPQIWRPMDVSTRLIDLPNWPSTMRAETVRGFRQYLVACNVKVGSSLFPSRVHWSHPADPGNVPSSWDETDPALDAGFQDLDLRDGQIMEQVPLGDANLIYCENGTHEMTLSGNSSIFNFRRIFDFGAFMRGCVVRLGERKQHFVVTRGDIVLHDRHSTTSIADRKVKTKFFSELDSATGASVNMKVAFDETSHQVWIAHRKTSPGSPAYMNRALVWSITDNTWTFVDLPEVSDIASISGSVLLGPVGGRTSFINLLVPSTRRLLQSSDTLSTIDGANRTARIAKYRLSVIDFANGRPVSNTTVRKLLCSVRPRIQAPNGTVISIIVSGYDSLADNALAVSTDSGTYTVGVDKKTDLYVDGMFLDVEFFTTSGNRWSMSGYDLDIAPLGEF